MLLIVVLALASAFFDRPTQTRETLSYSDFVNRVEANQIERVNLSADRTQAQVPNPSGGPPYLVNLPNDPDLINILTQHNVDIAVQPQSDEGFWFRIASTLFLPILLLVGIFFLFRRAQSGPGSQAMNFGKSKARVQMEPQTQVTFGDVAGIEQAKLELTEVVDFLKMQTASPNWEPKFPRVFCW